MDLDQARVHHERGQLAEAQAIYDQILNKDFDNGEVLMMYGTLLFQLGKHGLAASVLAMAAKCLPNEPAIYQNLANCYKKEHKDGIAKEMYEMALSIKPTGELWAAIGNLYINNGTPGKALEYYLKAVALDPRNNIIKMNMAIAYLELGDWANGWECYGAGLKVGIRVNREYGGLPEWDGTPGKTVIVWGEQGVGDEILFASCIPDAMKRAKLIFDCHPRLKKTFQRSFGIECHGTRKNQLLEWLPDCKADAQCSLPRLAQLFRQADADFPGTPYLKASKESRRVTSKRLRVGISWTGGTDSTRRDLRSMPLSALIPLLKHDCDFYSLQYTPESAREVCELEELHGIHVKHFPGLVECKDYDKTINFIATLDLVITVCTTVFHAAGALGVPVWCLVPDRPAWRYGQTGEGHRWYGSAKLYRQNGGEHWDRVIKRVGDDLADFGTIQSAQQRVA